MLSGATLGKKKEKERHRWSSSSCIFAYFYLFNPRVNVQAPLLIVRVPLANLLHVCVKVWCIKVQGGEMYIAKGRRPTRVED